MSERNSQLGAAGAGCFKEAVCIDAGRIYDSCSDKDCLENLQVYFTDCAQPLVDAASSIKIRKTEVLNVFIDVETVPFNRGFYSVDLTFFFKICADVFCSPLAPPTPLVGLATFSKKVILYGSEGNVKSFSSEFQGFETNQEECSDKKNLPIANVQVVDPICLSYKICECPDVCFEQVVPVPQSISCRFDGDFCCVTPTKKVYITLGLFSIVQLERSVQLLIPAYDFCVPDKESVTTTDNPCELFKKIKFPTNEFFPPRLDDLPEEEIKAGR